MGNQNELVDIICKILQLDTTKLIKQNGDITKFTNTHNGIYIIQISGYGLLESFEKIGHELMHFKQEITGCLKPYDKSFIEKFKGKKEGMFYEYDTECEAEAFGRRLAYHANELFFSNHPQKEIYESNKKLFSHMPSLKLESVTDADKLDELKQKMENYYNDAINKYDSLFADYDDELRKWHEK